MELLHSPTILAAALAGVAGVVALGFALRPGARRRPLLLLLGAALLLPGAAIGLALHPELVDARYRAFNGLYAALEPGMSRAEVLEAIGGYYPAGGERQPPRRYEYEEGGEVELVLFMNPEGDREPNCETISLRFADGRVQAKSYCRD